MNELDVRVAVWIAKGRPSKEARDLCIAGVAAAACHSGADQLILERDDSLMGADRKLIASILRQEKNIDLKYQHAAPHEYPLLWVSDAVAWCYSSGGDWKRRAEPLVEHRLIML
ncbi:MAG: hypothetical protein GX814_07605 [Microbacteriaceae bacterium]|nr:hypothetical protein [Microbacteriaceae bacterium]